MSVEFELSQNEKHLAEYYSLREQCFREELGLSDFDGSEDDDDRQGHILLAIEDGRCIGGVRISPSVTLQSQVQQLALGADSCCMWERFAFSQGCRSRQTIRDFFANLIQATMDVGYNSAMVLSSLRNARFYRQFSTPLGVDYEIHRHVPHCAKGKFAGLEHYLSVVNLSGEEPLRLTA